MTSRRRLVSVWLASSVLFLLYLWSLTESAVATIRVAGDRCTAILYGRTTTIECPGLAGGTLATYVGRAAEPAISRGRGPFNLLVSETDWDRLELTTADGAAIPPEGLLPPMFELSGRLLRPNDPGGLVFLRPQSDNGWVFLVDGETRRGSWWEWAEGEPSRPLQGIPLDKPLIAQAQSLTRQLLDSWQGALLILLAAMGLDRVARLIGENDRLCTLTTRIIKGGRAVPILLVLGVFAVTLHVSIHVLERRPHVQDSVTYLFQAQTMAAGQLTAPAPPLAGESYTAHFDQEFLLIRDGRWFGKYPPGYPALLAVGVAAGGHWIVNPLLAALAIPLLVLLVQSLYETRRAGPDSPTSADFILNPRIAGPLLLASSPFFLVMSGSLMAHPAELFWTLLFMAAGSRALRPGRVARRWAAVAGFALGVLFLTRQFTALTVGLGFGGGLAIAAWAGSCTKPGRSLVRALGPLALAALPLFLALPAYQAAVTGDPWTDPRLLYWPHDRVGFGPGIGEQENVFTYAGSTDDPAIVWAEDPAQPPRGHSPSRGLYNLGRNFNILEEDLFGWPALFTLSFVWLAFLLRRPSPADWVLLGTVAAIAAGYVAFWASGIAYGPRYLYAALPALVILTARGAGVLAEVAGRRATFLILAGLLLFNLINFPSRLESFRGYNFVSGGSQAAVEAQVQPPALVFVTAGNTDWWEYGAFFSANTPWLDGPVIYARDLEYQENKRLSAEFPGRSPYLWRDGQLRHYPIPP